MWWPSSTDPFWLANTVDNQARQQYYAVSGTPTLKCDGSTASWPSIQSTIQARMGVSSPLWLDLSATVNGNILNVTATAVANTNIGANHVIQIVLLDRYSYLPNSPNGMYNHYHAMLDMAPSASGQTFTAIANDTVHYYASFTLNPSWQISNLDIAAFIQNNTSKEVLQAHCEQVPVNFPGLVYQSYTLQDNGNNDGRAEPGETAYMYITLANQEAFQPATNVVGTLSTTDPTLTITAATVNFPNIPNGSTGTNSSPFVFQVSSTASPHPSSLHLHVVADPLQTTMDVDIPIYIGWPDVLLIDDDGGQGTTMETYYISTLQAMNVPYEYWQNATQGTPALALVSHYTSLIWFTAYQMDNVLTTAEQTLIQNYLNQGGCLFINGQNLAWGLSQSAPTFLSQVLHASFLTYNTNIRMLNGVAGNPVGNGMILNINSGGSGSGSATAPDGIGILTPAQEAFVYQSSTYRGGLTYEDTVTGHKLVFFSFPFEAVNGLPGSNTREQVLQAIFTFFGIGAPTNPNVEITLEPVSPPIQIPPTGGSFNFNVTLHNNESTTQTFDAWIMVQLPNLSWYGPVLGPVSLSLSAGGSITRLRTQSVPGNAPSGTYTYRGYVGDYSTAKWDSSSFTFVKLAGGDGAWTGNWENTGENFEQWQLDPVREIPSEYALSGAYPNPFNPMTTIRYELPEASFVKLTVYDLAGHEVARLVSGWREAGVQEVTLDASNLASGVYVYRLTAGDFTASGKMALIK